MAGDNGMEESVITEKLAVRTFGGLSVHQGRGPVFISWESQKARYLFCYLIIASNQWTHRDQLIEMLWPGYAANEGTSNFKTTLSRLRKSFSATLGINPVLSQGDAYRINVSDMAIDTSLFRQNAMAGIKLFCRGDTGTALGRLEAAQDLYTGEFLPEEPANSVIGAERNELATLHSSVLRCLGKIYAQEEKSDALEAFHLLTKNATECPA